MTADSGARQKPEAPSGPAAVSHDAAGRPSPRDRREQALQRQVRRLQQQLALLRTTSNRLTSARLVVFLAGFILSGVLFFLRGPIFWLPAVAVWLALFALTVALHRRVDAAIARHTLWLGLKRQHLARMALNWVQLPADRPLPPPPASHPFATDLDLVGAFSLHQLVDTAVSADGSLRLRQWLLDLDPRLEEVQRRQQLVRALLPLSLFRDRLALEGLLARQNSDKPWDAQALLAWIERDAGGQQHVQKLRPKLITLSALGIVNVILLLLDQLIAMPPLWAAGLAFYFVFYLFQGRAVGQLFQEAMSLQDALQQLAGVFTFLERPRFEDVQPLRERCAPFRRQNQPPSTFVRRLGRVVAAAGLSRNPVMWLVLNVFFPWDFYYAYRLQTVRAQMSGRLPRWLDVWFELEAASALANLGYLNPAYTFPVVHDPGSQAVPFAARQMGHPLIAHRHKVPNDFSISEVGRVDIITGSNMAGKSSFLRTVGANLCLAYAGGPVDAAALETRLFRLYTAIRVTDSVTDGISYFYAEVKRLKALLLALEDADARPLFFLIDEIFRGTNNRERLLGSRAYIRELVGQNGAGLIATHDLELVQLADEIAQVSNYHFRDSVREGRMIFDYRLRPGPSPTTNALKVMAQEGLPVPKSEPGGAPG